jgi:hypothetical protein
MNVMYNKPKGTYIVAQEGGDYVKLGVTVNLTYRMKQLQMHSPYKLYELFWLPYNDIEDQLKREFKELHVRGEWYLRGGKIYQFINEYTHAVNHGYAAVVSK